MSSPGSLLKNQLDATASLSGIPNVKSLGATAKLLMKQAGGVRFPGRQSSSTAIPGLENAAWSTYSDLVSSSESKALDMSLQSSFCEYNQRDPEKMNTKCNTLTEYNCKRVGCCVFTSQNKCVSGNRAGPNYDPLQIDYYYYKNKCYGMNCPAKKC